MKKKFVRLISAVLSAAMTLTAVPLSAFAEGEEHTHDGESNVITTPLDFREKTADENGAGWSWDYDTKTLTLDGVNIQATTDSMSVVTVPDGTEIVLNGNNTIVQTDTGKSDTYVLSAVNNKEVNCDGTMTISGDGVLNAENRSTDSMARSLGGSIILNGGTVNATGTVKTNSLEIHNDGVLNANATTASFEGVAVNVSGGITVDGNGSLTAVGCANESTLNSAILLTSNFDKISVSENGSITVPEGNAARVGIYYSGNNGDGMDAEISGGKVTAYGAKYGIYKVNLIMSGTGSVYTTGGSYAIGQTVPTIDENEFVIKGSTEFKASESAVTGEVKYNSGYYEIGGADAKTVVIKPDTSPRIILGKQTGIFKTEEYEIIEGMTDTKLKGTVYFDITLKNMSDEEFADARGYFGGDEPDLLASIIKTDYGWVCMVCDTEFSVTYDTDNTLTIKCGDIVSNTVQVKSNANRFNKVTQGDNTNRTVFYTNTSQEEKDNYKLVSTYTVDSESISYNWYSTNSAYSADELGAAVSGSNGEFKLADNIPAGNYVLYCDITYSDGDSTETVTEKFTFTYKECAHENGYSDGKCTDCGYVCPHSNIDIDTGKCNECERQFVATISTDGSAPIGCDTLADCLDSITADTGNYVKLYQDIGDATATLDTIDVNHNVMIDLNGHKLNNIKLGVNKDVKLTLTGTAGSYVKQVYVRNGGSFVIDSAANAEFNTIFVEADAGLAVNDGAKVTAEQLTVIASVADDGTTTTSVKLATGMTLGGLSYHSQNNSRVVKLGNLLDVTRQALQRDDNGEYLDLYKEYGGMGYPYAFTVVEHTDADHKYGTGTGKCEECGKPCEHGGDINTDTGICSICGAVVSVALYTDKNGSLKYVDTDELHSLLNEYNGSGTIKLFKDYSKPSAQYDLYGELTIDLNGRRLNIRSITPCKNGKLTIKNSGNPVMLGCNVYPTNDASYAGGTLIIDGDVVLDTSIYVYDSSTVILKAGAYTAGLYARDSKTLYDMLGEGKAFFKTDGTLFNASVKEISSSETLTIKDHSHTYVDGKCDCGYVCPHSDVDIDTGKCTECEYQYAAVIVKDGAVASVYKETEMGAAFEAADSDANTGCTLKVYKNYAGSYTTLSGKFTLWIAEEANVGTLTVSGDITVTGSKKNNSIYGDFNVADGGKLTFDENCGAKGTVSVGAGTFDCYSTFSITLNINDASSDVILHGGGFKKICYNGGGDRANAEILTLLAENRMFMKYPNAEPIDGSKTLLKDGLATVFVTSHEDHSYDSTTGKCTICGKRCGHTDVDSKTGVCPTCKYQLTAGISGVGTASYFGNIDDAFAAATSGENNGCTLTLYQDCELTTDVMIIEKALNLNVNGKTITTSDKEIIVKLGTLTLTGGGKVDGNVTVAGGTLINGINDTNDSKAVSITNLYANYIGEEPHIELYGGVYDSFTFNTYNPDVAIYGGSFGEIKSESETSITVGSLLAKNRAFVRTLPAELIDGSAVTLYNGLTNVSVVEHEHRYNVETGKCPCGVCALAIFTETTQSSETYTFIESTTQFKNIAENEADGVLKLTGDVDCIVKGIIINGNKTIDMNGHTLNVSVGTEEISAVAVYGNVTFENSGSKRAVINATGVYSYGMVTVNGDIEFDAFATFEDGDALINAGVFKSIYVQGRSVIEILGSGKALASENGEILNASVQQIYKAGNNMFVTAHPKHTYDDHCNCACGYKCLHDGEGQVNEDSANKVCSECGATIYAKVTTADGKAKYFDDITEGLRYADKAENKGCVFTLVTSGEIKSEVTLSSGQFTITANNYGTIDKNSGGRINIDGADVIAEGHMLIKCEIYMISGSLTLPEGSNTRFGEIYILGGTVNISEGVNADNNAGVDKLFITNAATDAKVTIGGGTYRHIVFEPFKLKDVLTSGARVIRYDNPSDPTAEKTATALLYSDIAEESYLAPGDDDGRYYLVTKCEHKNEDGSYAFNDSGICEYCGSEFAASVSYMVDGSAKTELFGDIYDAFDKANEIGTATVTLYKDITDSESTRDVTVTSNVTIALNGKTLGGRRGIARIPVSDGGTLTVNGDGNMDTPIYVNENSKLVINGGGYFYSVSVKEGGNAEIGGGTIRGLSVRGNAKLSGGKFNEIEIFNGNLESVLADGYGYKVDGGEWLSIAERAKNAYSSSIYEDKPVTVVEAPIKSASIAWVGEEAPVIYRNGEKYLYVNITYELAVGSSGATYSDFVNGNNRIKDYNLYNKYMVHCYEIGKLAAKDGEVEYYIVLKCNGYEYKSNVLKLTLATCSHPEDSFSYENDGLVICGICDALIEAEVVDADGKSLGYADIESAIKLAQENEGSTVKLMSEGVSESITVTGGRFTVDFNGKKVFYQFDVNGGDVTFTSSVKQADAETLISGITVNGTDAKVTIDGKIKLGSVTLSSGTLTVNSTDGYIKELSINGGKADIDGAEIDTLVFKGGDLAIRNVTVGSLDINKKATDATEHNIVIESGSFDTITCLDDSDYNIVKALASERRLRGTESGIIYEYSEIESLTEATDITVEKCDHKYANGNIAVDDDYVCYYCNSQIVATVSYTAGGSETTDLFSDIYDAFAKANEIGTATVTLQKNITDDITDTIAVTGNVTLELNGKKLSTSGFDPYYTIEVKSGKLTVNGSGTIKCVVVRNGGDAEINGGTFSDFRIEDGGNAVINGGKFNSIKVSGEGRNVGQLLADGYAYKNFDGFWSTVAEREKRDIASVNVLEAPIKSATITAEDESPIIYRNGSKVASFTADVTYTGNETLYVTKCLIDGTVISEKTELSGNRYYLFSGEVDKAVAEDGEIQYYCIFTYDGYEYKSNVVTLTVATCPHPVESVKCDDNGYVCGICDRTLPASVELSDGTLSYYDNLNYAIGAAQENEGCTLKLLNYSLVNNNETFDISKGRFTVDLNKNDGKTTFAFNVKGGDITFTALQKASISFTGVTVSGENANVLIDSKATLNYLVVNSGKVSADGANIGAITINGGDTVINDVNTDYLSMKAGTTDGSRYNVSIVSGRFGSFTCENGSNYTLGRAIASGSRVIGLNAIVGSGFKYAEIQSMTKANYLNVIKCDHKDENGSYVLDGNLCPYCNEEIAATVSYTADGSEQTDLFSDIYDAFAKANERGTATITLYKDIENSELTRGINVTGNVTLALNGKKLGYSFVSLIIEVSDGGMLTVDGDGKMTMPIIVNENAKLTVNGGEIATVMIYKDGDAVIGGGFIEDLDVKGNVKLSGGKFYNIEIANGSLESLLAGGYAYKVDGGAWLSIAERAKEKYYSWNNDNKPVNVEEAPIKSATISTEINKLYRNSNANPTLKFNLTLAHVPNLNDSYVSKRYGINSYVSGDTGYSSLSALVTDAKLSADEIIDKAGDSVAAKIYFVVTTGDGYEIKSNTVSIDLVDCDHSQVVDPTADKETAGNITEPTYCEICESKFNAKITKGDDVRYYNDLDEAAKDAQKSENEGCTLYPLYNKNGYGGQLIITEGNFTLKYAVRTAFSRPIIINGKAKLKVTGRCAVTTSENPDAFIVQGGDVTFDGLATGSNVTINGGNVTMAANNINRLTINGGNVSISSGGFAEIVTTVSDKVIADYIDPGFWVQDRGTKEWIDIYSLDKATASSTNVLTVRLCPMQIIKPIDTVYYTNGYYPGDIPSLQISAEPLYSNEVDAKVAYQWIAIDENGNETVIEGATDRKLSLENLTTGRYYCRLTYSNAATAGVSMASDVVTATITECEHSGGKATCTERAKCEICGAEYGEMKPHSYAHIKAPEYLKSAATCTAKAVYYTSCTECGLSSEGTKNEKTFEYGEALGHSFGEWSSTAPTCTKDGSKVRKCSRCDKVETEVIPATGHKYVDTVIKPTYTEKGYTLHKCSRCGSSYKDSYTNVLVLAKISGLKTVSRTDTTAKISWNKNPDADGYIIEQYDDSRWTVIGKITSNSTVSFMAKTLVAGSTNKLRARAYKGTVYSAYTYININTAPSAITGFTLKNATSSTLNVAWDRNLTGDGYILDKYDGSKWVTVAKVTNHATLNNTANNLKAGTSYKFRIRAYKVFGSVTVYGSYTYLTAGTKPAAMSGIKVKSKTNLTASLQWNKNISADGYVLDKYDGSKWITIKTLTSNTDTSFNVTGLKASTTFKFRLRAYKNYGSVKEYSEFTYFTVNTRPYTTTGMKCNSKTNLTANLQWNKNRSADGYVLDKYDGTKWVTIKTFTSNANTSFNVTGLRASTTFNFRLRAYKNFDNGKVYSEFTYLNVNTRPYTTTGFKMKSATKNSVTLQWNKNISANGYCIEKWDGSKWVQVKRYTSNANVTYTATGLKADTAYKFRIRAYKTIGNVNEYSAYSAVVTARTQK